MMLHFFCGAGIAIKELQFHLRIMLTKCISVSDVWSDDKHPIDLHSLDALLTEMQLTIIVGIYMA